MRWSIAVLLSAFIAIGCNNDKKVTVKSEDGSTTTTVDMETASEINDEMNKKSEELRKLTPLTLDQLKAMIPEELAGMKRVEYNTYNNAGVAMATARYQKDDTTEMDLVIYDGAGEAGAGLYNLHYWTKMNMQSEGSYGYTKTIDFKGGKAVETYETTGERRTLTFTGNDRLLVVISGRNFSADLLKQAAQSLELKI